MRRRKRAKTGDALTYANAVATARERYPTTAERRAYLRGFRLGWFGADKPDFHESNWVNAYARGYWDGVGVREEERVAHV